MRRGELRRATCACCDLVNRRVAQRVSRAQLRMRRVLHREHRGGKAARLRHRRRGPPAPSADSRHSSGRWWRSNPGSRAWIATVLWSSARARDLPVRPLVPHLLQRWRRVLECGTWARGPLRLVAVRCLRNVAPGRFASRMGRAGPGARHRVAAGVLRPRKVLNLPRQTSYVNPLKLDCVFLKDDVCECTGTHLGGNLQGCGACPCVRVAGWRGGSRWRWGGKWPGNS